MSLAFDGKIERGLTPERLRARLRKWFSIAEARSIGVASVSDWA